MRGRARAGVTLVELGVGMALLAVLTLVFGRALSSGGALGVRAGEVAQGAADRARMLEQLQMDLRSALAVEDLGGGGVRLRRAAPGAGGRLEVVEVSWEEAEPGVVLRVGPEGTRRYQVSLAGAVAGLEIPEEGGEDVQFTP